MDMRGKPDLFGHELRVTQTGFADEIAERRVAAHGPGGRGATGGAGARPVLVGTAAPATALIRAAEEDLFR